MQMIDLMKRLVELDAKNPSIVKENVAEVTEQNLEECGTMDSMGSMSQPRTPASINMTAASGEELSGMLKDIMSLAGMQKVTPDHMGMDHDPMVLTTEPVKSVGPAASDQEVMRSVLDKMNPADDDEEGQDGDENGKEQNTEETWDNAGEGSQPQTPFSANEFAHRENQPGQGDRMDGDKPKAFATFEEQLMAEYKNFISEN